MESIWHDSAKRPHFDSLAGDVKTDALIIGGGIAGLLCGYVLKRAGVDCVIAEADTICSGVTGNTTAKVTVQHGLIYDKMIKRFGVEIAELYYSAQEKAFLEYANLSKDIECDFRLRDSYVYSLKSREKIEREVEALNKIGCKATFEENLPLPFRVSGAVKIENQAEFHPLKLLFHIARNLKIFEKTRVLELVPDGALTDKGKIIAKNIIVATHFPFINKYGGYFIKMYQHRSYVIALKEAQNVDGMYVDEENTGLSFRNYQDLLLLGGGGHRTGKKGGNYEELRRFADRYYPNAEEVCHWATQDCKTLDDIPYIGQYTKSTPSVFVATGFNKWGMTSAMTAAMLLSDLITGKENAFSKVFLPQRSILRPRLAVHVLETLASFLTPTVPRCPHLGCALKYNKYEHSWDCTCHGSRFTKEGRLLENPSTKDLNI